MANTIDSNVLSSMNPAVAAKPAQGSTQELSDSFMTLLVTQLKNQDPLKPMENAEMTSQLAQINTVNGIQDLNTTLQGITGQIDAGQALQATALIGQGVLVPGNQILSGGKGEDDTIATTPFGIELASSADKVTITVTNSNGEVVRQYLPEKMGALDKGVHSFAWDGKLADGTAAPSGAYRFNIEASQGDELVNVTSLNYALVGGVIKSEGGPRLDLGAKMASVSLDDVRQIL